VYHLDSSARMNVTFVAAILLMQLPVQRMPLKHNEVCSCMLNLMHRYFIMEVQHCCVRDTLYLLRDEPRVDVRSEILQMGISACHVECAADGLAAWHWEGSKVACKHKNIPWECLNVHSKIMTRIVRTALCRK